MSFVVMTDTSANLEKAQILDNELQVIPFSYIIDGEEHNILQEENFNAEEYYARIRSGMKVATSQIPPRQYADFFEPALREGQDIIFICMSSGISGSFNSARIAAQMMMQAYPGRRIEIIDTLGASLGEGIIALQAAPRPQVLRREPATIKNMDEEAQRQDGDHDADDGRGHKVTAQLEEAVPFGEEGIVPRTGTVLARKGIDDGKEVDGGVQQQEHDQESAADGLDEFFADGRSKNKHRVNNMIRFANIRHILQVS